MDDPVLAWKLVNLLWGALFGLGYIVVKYVWRRLETVTEKVRILERNALQTHVTKPDLEKAFQNLIQHHVAPLNRDVGIIIRALAAQEIHLDHPRE